MVKRLENIFNRLRKGIIITGLSASLFFGCSKDNVITGPIQTPKPPITQQNRPPIITSSPVTSINENDYYGYQVQATDQDGDKLTYSLSKSPSWLTVYDYGYVNGPPPEVSSDQTSEIEIIVSDGKESAKQNYTLTVKNVSNAYVLSPGQLTGLTVNENSLFFSQPVNFAVGDVVGSGISTTTPNGLIREVTSVSSDRRTIQTKQATLENIVRNAFMTYSGKLLPSSVISSSVSEGISLSRSSVEGFDFNVKLTNVVLYDRDGNKNTTGDQLIANGNISFNTDLIFNFNIADYKIKDLTFRNSTNIGSDVTVGSNVLGVASSQHIKIAEYKFEPFIAGYLPTPIPIPIVLVPALGVYAGINPTNVNPLSVRLGQDTKVEVGLIYNGAWSPISSLSNSFTFSNPAVNGNLELKLYAGPQVELLLYGIAGPFADLNGRLRLKTNGQDWELYGGFGASAGVKMEVLSKRISAQFAEIINYEKLLAKSSSPPTSAEKILFASIRNNDAEIYSINPDGSQETNLTNNSPGWDISPSWSPDASKILYSSRISSSSDYDIYVMNKDGSNKTRLTNSSMQESDPVFSSDGTKVAYTAANVSGYDQIYVMNANGSFPANITSDYSHFYWDLSWAPSQRIALYSNKDSPNGEIYILNPDGSGITRLTSSSSYDRNPSWSPDGTKIVFTSGREGNDEIYTMDVNGSNQTNISKSPGTYDFSPSWSPDGRKIVYVSRGVNSPDNSNEIWIMDYPSGSNKTRITNNGYNDGSPSWSPR